MRLFERFGIISASILVCLIVLGIALFASGCSKSKAVAKAVENTTTVEQNSTYSSSQASSNTESLSNSASSGSSASSSGIAASNSTVSSSSSQQAGHIQHIICIDPGHQIKVDLSQEPVAPGATVTKDKNPGGTVGVVTKLPEYALNMIVGQKLEQRLEALGYKVVMTRTNNDGNISNIGRAQVANSSGAEMFVRIHADGSTDHSINGISVLIPGNQYITDQHMLSESRKIGGILLDSLVKSTGAKSRGLVVRDDMTGFNWSKVPVVLVEMGFMSNPDEDRAMSTDAYQNKLVDGFVNGINQYFQQKDADSQ